MPDRRVLLVDGPYAGKLIPMPAGITRYFLPPPYEVPTIFTCSGPDAAMPALSDSVLYQTRVLTIFGRRMDIGWCGGAVPADDVLAEHLLSDNAKYAAAAEG
mgnify:CR=1 FL=1|jgi:hypothetical protein